MPVSAKSDVLPGKSYPIGATVINGGVNFSLFSRNSFAVELLLFDAAGDKKPSRIIRLDPSINRTFHYWHVFVKGLAQGQIYAYRVDGPFAPDKGDRFDHSKVLLDPYARAIAIPRTYNREAAIHPGDNCGTAMKSVIANPGDYDWEGDEPLKHPYTNTIIYETHIAGFTKHPSSGISAAKRGTYAGLIEKIPYLKDLGITAVELLPVQQFDEQDAPAGLANYWGYSPVAFFVPHQGYSSSADPIAAVNEFRDMAKALHRSGIEVILDVVFNHTAEGDHRGPTISFKGLENSVYYILDKDKRHYANYSGCGNSVNANHSVTRRLIRDCLRYWVTEMHVDGFRFDLASVMSRGESGQQLENPPVLWAIESDPVLAGTKLIAEAWDAAGLYQVGSFTGEKYVEWNGQFRDDVRRFVKGENDTAKKFSLRMCGSPDLYLSQDKTPHHSINFVTCHDGFTINDLVSYNIKHNEPNGGDNKDGLDYNHSWNCGAEGPTKDQSIEEIRLRQIKNLFTILFLSQGTPMTLMGDEIRRTQLGNNNAYCHDNEISWFDWSQVKKNSGLIRFVKDLIRLIKTYQLFTYDECLCADGEPSKPGITWHGVKIGKPDWTYESHTLAATLTHPEADETFHVIFNAYWEPLTFEIPPAPNGKQWVRLIDTSLSSPEDIVDEKKAVEIKDGIYSANERSVILLTARKG